MAFLTSVLVICVCAFLSTTSKAVVTEGYSREYLQSLPLSFTSDNDTLLSRYETLYQISRSKDVNQLLLPDAPDDSFDLTSYTPFCSSTLLSAGPPPPKKKAVDIECIRWEEHELDMLMMYMDLLAVGMKRSLARQFYRQVRCLSRRNTVMNPDKKTWDVCFTYDYSKHVGILLSHYIKQDAILKSPVKSELQNEKLKKQASSRTFSIKQLLRMSDTTRSEKNLYVSNGVIPTDHNRGLFLLLAFAKSNAFRLFTSENLLAFLKEQTSCCDECVDDENYFANIEQDQCLLNPFGKHCCHKACKSLARLRVGASSSISYCCENSNPSLCKR